MRTSKKLYTPDTIYNYTDSIQDTHYIETIPGCLIDTIVCIPYDAEKHYHLIFREIATTSWSSAYRMERRKELPEDIKEELAALTD